MSSGLPVLAMSLASFNRRPLGLKGVVLVAIALDMLHRTCVLIAVFLEGLALRKSLQDERLRPADGDPSKYDYAVLPSTTLPTGFGRGECPKSGTPERLQRVVRALSHF